LRAEGLQRDVAQLRADLAETKASARDAASTALLTRLVTKLGA